MRHTLLFQDEGEKDLEGEKMFKFGGIRSML
jgi:hypothetical protein